MPRTPVRALVTVAELARTPVRAAYANYIPSGQRPRTQHKYALINDTNNICLLYNRTADK